VPDERVEHSKFSSGGFTCEEVSIAPYSSEMPEAAVIGLLIAFPLVGLFARRWLAVILPFVGWPLFYLGLNKGWWGYGTGDGWQYAAALLTAVGVVTTALAVALAGGVRASRPRRAQSR
jgi:hypothetical protein